MNWTIFAVFVQIFFAAIIGLYFWNQLRSQRTQKISIKHESYKELEQLRKMRLISLTKPLSEKIRPMKLEDIVGQEDGIKALRTAICSSNPQHVLIYGPPGVGKTAAARLILEEAKKDETTPFLPNAVFVELDATIARFDERGIADPLIGSVHDPLYQGAGAMGQAGIPQPKQGAVTKAHGGVLFLDEIGELHPIQMNKLLKVLEDRKVFLESAYYSKENTIIPAHLHDIFQNGLPADFRLIGATTRSPEDIPPAIRSRCMEIFFSELTQSEIAQIAKRAANKINCKLSNDALDMIIRFAKNGREAVNIIQTAAGIVMSEEKERIDLNTIEWVIYSSQLTPRPEQKVKEHGEVGIVNGLAVYGTNMGMLLEIEALVTPVEERKGEITITGVVEEESISDRSKSITRKSLVKGSIENVMTVLRREGIDISAYDVHINFPGGTPIDGPSAGIAIATAMFSSLKNITLHPKLAMTGELSIYGKVKPVGGILAKIKAAKEAGVTKVIIPEENNKEIVRKIEGIEIIPVSHFSEVLHIIQLLNQLEEDKNKFSTLKHYNQATTKHVK